MTTKGTDNYTVKQFTFTYGPLKSQVAVFVIISKTKPTFANPLK